jgi:apolipoprotein N-acyltransferase
MLEKLFQNKAVLATTAGICVFLAFPKFDLLPFVFLFPLFFNLLTLECKSPRESFLYGFLTSFFVMLGGFYWVVYVIHEFGYMSWTVSILLYLGFCGFGALNFPIFSALATWWQRRLKITERGSFEIGLWYSIFLPLLFTFTEYLIPKLFPWYVGHSLYQSRWANQIVEITGSEFLTFCIYSAGSVAGLFIFRKRFIHPPRLLTALVPTTAWIICIGFSFYALNKPPEPTRPFRVAMIQANIGSLERVDAQRGLHGKLREVVTRHIRLSKETLAAKPDLILWPEAALPFDLGGQSFFAQMVRDLPREWQTTIIAGAFAASEDDPLRDYNTAYLLEPETSQPALIPKYYKNILLAFGEYMPLGETFPALYRWFPQVSNFMLGKTQRPFVLRDGTRLGISICYEAIVPSFMRKVAQGNVQALINLTNDSWFGPTAEPYLHGALTVFRAIEFRLPLFRVTNTGTSFAVSARGEISEMTPVYREATLVVDGHLPLTPPKTFYLRFGGWFPWFYLSSLVILLVIFFRKSYAPIPI